MCITLRSLMASKSSLDWTWIGTTSWISSSGGKLLLENDFCFKQTSFTDTLLYVICYIDRTSCQMYGGSNFDLWFLHFFLFHQRSQESKDHLHLTPRLLTQQRHAQVPPTEPVHWAEALFCLMLSLQRSDVPNWITRGGRPTTISVPLLWYVTLLMSLPV